DDFTRLDMLALAVKNDIDAGGLAARKGNPLDKGIGDDRQIGPLARLAIEIASGGRHTPVILIGERQGKGAVLERAVIIREIGMPIFLDAGEDRLGEARPILRKHPADRNAPILAMHGTVEIKV